jgi:iron(III) transport system ATP-binding protein
VVIDNRQGDTASIRLGPLLLNLPHHGIPVGAAELSVRPQAVLLRRNGGELTGRITRAAYLGSHMEYWIAFTGLDKELFVTSPDVAAPLAVGDPASATLALSGVALVLRS